MKRTLNSAISAAALLFVVLVIPACGPSTGEIFKQYAPALLAQESALKSLTLAPQSGTLKPAGPLNPQPVYNAKTGTYNIEFIARPRLKDLAAPVEIDFYLTDGGLLMALTWLHKAEAEGGGGKAGDYFVNTVRRGAQDVRYLLVYDYGAYTRPVATSANQYVGGELTLDCHLLDMATKKTVSFFQINASVPATMKYEYKEGKDNPAERLQSWVSSAIWESARRQLGEKLKEVAGAEIEFDKY